MSLIPRGPAAMKVIRPKAGNENAPESEAYDDEEITAVPTHRPPKKSHLEEPVKG